MSNQKNKNSFAVTLTLTPEFCKNSTEYQYDNTYVVLDTVLKSLKALEYSIHTELTKENNIHYHILIRLTSRMKCDDLKVKILSELYAKEGYLTWGFACVKKCYDSDGWINYLKKQPYINKKDYLF